MVYTCTGTLLFFSRLVEAEFEMKMEDPEFKIYHLTGDSTPDNSMDLSNVVFLNSSEVHSVEVCIYAPVLNVHKSSCTFTVLLKFSIYINV